MEASYHVTVNIQTPMGMLEIGNFFLGTEKSFAEETMDELEGSNNLGAASIRLDLLSTTLDNLPVCIKSIGCNLDQYASNCKILTREVFRHFMFEKGSL